jgi:hypothetical protein
VLLPVSLALITTDDYFGDNIVFIKKSVVSHLLPQEKVMVPVPAVNVVTFSEPTVAVDAVKPTPTLIVQPSG